MSMNISHINHEGNVQLNDDHQQGVAARAESFAKAFGMGDCGRIMGLLHDKGKEQLEWQKYIQGVTGYNKDYAHMKTGPNHSYVGAVIAQKHSRTERSASTRRSKTASARSPSFRRSFSGR